jgi:hypothetical protein
MRDNTNPQSQYCGTALVTDSALETAPAMHAQEAHCATQPRFLAFSQAQRAPPAHANQRRARWYHHTTRTRAQTRTTRQAPPSTATRQRHGVCHPNSACQQATHRTSHTTTQHTNTQAPHAHSQTSLAHRRKYAAHTARHTAPRTAHLAHRKNTQSHTRTPRHTHPKPIRLPNVDGMLPES